ncbi:MAG: YbaK/EbsC family protein, partial [Actinomycetota bacterium]
AAAAAGVTVAPVRFEHSTRTAEEAAQAVGCEVGQIVKSLVFATDRGGFVLVLTSGANRVDEAKMVEAGAGHLSRADAGAVKAVTGYSIGSTPPFGLPRSIDVFMDEDLLRYEQVWSSAGRPDAVLAIAPDDLARISGAIICKVS